MERDSKILCESLACGIPIITTNQRGCRELIDGNKNGLMCKSKDYKDLAKQFNNFLILMIMKLILCQKIV